METTNYMAHTRGDNETQPLLDHLRGTAKLASNNALDWGRDFACCCGIAHDIGKYSDAFQKRIRGSALRVDHATAGGQELNNPLTKLGLIAAYCVMGHHGGMPNGGAEKQDHSDDATLHGRLKRNVEDYSAYKQEVKLPKFSVPAVSAKWVDGFDASFFARMIFLSLVDADWLDTERFCNHGNEPRGGFSAVSDLYEKLSARLENFLMVAGEITDINARRNELLKDCLLAAGASPGLFKLTAPTGSGKTISSLAFALKHAVRNGLRRVIYVIPYNSIIDQNAAVFEDLLGSENILRHNSDVQYDEEDDNTRNKRFSVENWDFPVIITSSVQFFESLFSNKPSKCRKLHNIANSVVIFDEAQMIPVPYLLPSVHAMETLVTQYGCSCVLATATQSAADAYFRTLKPKEISENPDRLYTALRRTTIRTIDESLTDDRLAELLLENENVLCVVNTRLHAQSLYRELNRACQDGVFHLSTTMYPAHRKRILDDIRSRLKSGHPCRVVSTSLVEAGVDLDFVAVFREEAGLDSIIQAAGRCNREGKRKAEDSFVYVFSSAEHKPPRMIQPNISAYRQVARECGDLAGLDTVEAYFTQLFYNLGDESLDSKNIVGMFNDGVKSFSFPFEDAARAFKLIDDSIQKTVFFLGECPELETCLRDGERTRELFRAIGSYGINLYDSDVSKLRELGAVEMLDESVILLSAQYYSEEVGVALMPEGGQALFV